ncbi:MAG: glycosyltransferase family 2 protein [Lachnospiraceae bacterium]|nr:glycosyltransferase family 2 protein [Lachnospiraceae bacterium]
MSKVAICIPTYNDEGGVSRLLHSIKEQTFTDFEIIITDDTRDDRVKCALEPFLTDMSETDEDCVQGMLKLKNETDICVRYYHNKEQLGPAPNWNKAISGVDSEYIKIMHQDDWFSFEDSLNEYVKMLDEDKDALLAFSGSRQVSIKSDDPTDVSSFYDRAITDEQFKELKDDPRKIYINQYIGAPSAVIYRNNGYLFDPPLRWLVDADFYIGILKDNGRMVYTKKPLVSIGVSEGQMTNSCAENPEVNIREYTHLFKKYDLGSEPGCRKKFIDKVVYFKGTFDDVKDCGISKEEFRESYMQRKKYLRNFYFHLILRKLHFEKGSGTDK